MLPITSLGNVTVVTANTRGRFTRNSAPLWARGQDAFLVIRGTRDRFRPTAMFAFKVDLSSFQIQRQSFTVVGTGTVSPGTGSP